MCRNLVKSGKKCETGEIYEVLEITVRTKSSCWQCARNFCISRCCPTVTWLSSLLYFLRFNWCNENVFFVDHLLQCRPCTARLSNSYEIEIKKSAHTRSFGNVKNKKIFFRIVMMFNNSAFGLILAFVVHNKFADVSNSTV